MPDEIVTTQPDIPVESGVVQPSENLEELHVDESPDPASMQAEIEELRRKKEKYEADAKYWREQKARDRAEYFREKGQPPQQAPPAPQEPKEPQVEDFQDYNAYVSALADFRADRKIMAWERKKAEDQSRQTAQGKLIAFSEKLHEGLEMYEDFDQVISDPSATHMNNMVVSILMDLDNPAPVAYYLNKNRAEGIAISRMTPYQAALAINKVEAEIGKLGGGKTTPKTVTNAPPPINPVGSRESGTKDPEKMTGKEYEKWLRERGVKMY